MGNCKSVSRATEPELRLKSSAVVPEASFLKNTSHRGQRCSSRTRMRVVTVRRNPSDSTKAKEVIRADRNIRKASEPSLYCYNWNQMTLYVPKLQDISESSLLARRQLHGSLVVEPASKTEGVSEGEETRRSKTKKTPHSGMRCSNALDSHLKCF